MQMIRRTARGRPRTGLGRQGGFTLVELMISMVIASIAIAATLALGFALNNTHGEHQVMMKTERAARGSMDTMADAIRSASPGVTSGVLDDLVGCNGSSAINVVNDSGGNGPDELFVIYGAGSDVSTLRTDYTDPTLATLTNLNVFDASQFRVGDYVVVTDFNQGILLRVENLIDNGDNWDITTTPSNACALAGLPATWPAAGAGSGYPKGSLVIRARMARFFVCPNAADADCPAGTVPKLMMDPDGVNATGANGGDEPPEPVALGIEDLQIAVGADVNGNGLLEEANPGTTTDEMFYNATGDAAAPSMAVTPWRAIRLTVTARSLNARTNSATSTPTAAEDNTTVGASDEFRRRTVSDVIEIRNIVGSP